MRGISFNKGWKFTLEDVEAPHLITSNDDSWQGVDIPHDWSINQPFDKEKGDGCTGYLLGGIGWYRKRFVTTKEMKDKEVWIIFDGIYNRSNIYINGKLVKFHPYGYSPVAINLSEYLNEVDCENLIAVKVDHTRYADSRWYTGSGIYRKVSMHILPKVNIPVWGTFIKFSNISNENALGNIEITIHNSSLVDRNIRLNLGIYDYENNNVYTKEIEKNISNKETIKLNENFNIVKPILWNIFDGKQYKLKIQVIDNEVVTQVHETKFGIRECKFDTNKGFFINGNNTLIKGVCLHHEAGLVGAAVPLDVWKRRLLKLKDCGCNAIRTAHNPASEDFLDLCDELGFLVQEEFYDEWDNPKDKRYNGNEKKVDYITRGHAEFFKDYAKSDLQDTILRDRNHPCIFQWSIGNEIEWTYPKYNDATGYFGANANGNYFWTLPPYSPEEIRENIKKLPMDKYEIGSTATKLSEWTKELDDTRVVTANCILPSASYESGYTDALDVVGFSYRQVMYERAHINYPDKPIMGTENLAQWHEWKQVLEKDYISGIFLWTGIDYIGEAGNVHVWPRKGLKTGLLDLAGFEKPSYYMFKSLWREDPQIHILTQSLENSLYEVDEQGELADKVKDGWKTRLWEWHEMNEHWNYCNSESVVVEVYSNCDSVTLYLNDVELSTKYLKDFEDHIYKWNLPFSAGALRAVGIKNGQVVEESILTAGPVEAVMLTADKQEIDTNSDTVSHIVAQLVDGNKVPVKDRELEIEFDIQGEINILGVDNGDVDSVQPYNSNKVTTKNGKALLMVQGKKKGNVEIKVNNIKSNNIKIFIN